MSKRLPLRQGDVLLIPVEHIPDKATTIKPEDGRLILALGEATGHHHSIAIIDREAELLTVADEVDRYLRVRSHSVLLAHQEHGAIAIPRGKYVVRQQVEYTPAEIRRVAD